MDVFKQLMRRPTSADNLSLGVFVVAAVYALVRGTARTILAGLAFVLMMLGGLPKQPALAFLVGASVILLMQTRGSGSLSGFEGFEDASGAVVKVEAEKAEAEKAEAEKEKEKKAEAEKEKSEKFAGGKVMLPDNATRKEPLELGKAYKLPNENDDKGFHLDAGTTFLNAYKALKPDQIAAMTKDTQDLLATQKSLVGMLESFGPLMKDMNKITGFFGPTAPQ